jgi:hypothetical protein
MPRGGRRVGAGRKPRAGTRATRAVRLTLTEIELAALGQAARRYNCTVLDFARVSINFTAAFAVEDALAHEFDGLLPQQSKRDLHNGWQEVEMRIVRDAIRESHWDTGAIAATIGMDPNRLDDIAAGEVDATADERELLADFFGDDVTFDRRAQVSREGE